MAKDDTTHTDPNGDAERRVIVVGVDGSERSDEALGFAFREAGVHGLPLAVIYAWEVPYRWAEGFNVRWAEDREQLRRDAQKVVEGQVDRLLDGKPRPDWLKARAIEGYPAQVLTEASRHATMLVVGCRGRGGFGSMVLGSVSTACVHTARCPVVVIRPADEHDEKSGGGEAPAG